MFCDGSFRTGNLGVRLDDGYLSLVGRIKELINRGGAKIAPRDIDELLLAHGVVREAMMCGVPDAEYGERVEAAVVVTSSVTLAELSRHCADRLVRFKLPARVRVVREIPVGPTGKAARASVAPASWVHESRGSRRRRDWRLRGRNARSRGHRNAPRSRARSTSTRFAQKGCG